MSIYNGYSNGVTVSQDEAKNFKSDVLCFKFKNKKLEEPKNWKKVDKLMKSITSYLISVRALYFITEISYRYNINKLEVFYTINKKYKEKNDNFKKIDVKKEILRAFSDVLDL